MKRAAVLVLAAVAIVLAVVFWPTDVATAPAPARSAVPLLPPPAPEARRGETAARAVVPPPAGAQPANVLPRPPPPSTDRPLPQVPREPPSGHRGPVDKRGGNNPNAARELEILSYAFETLDDDVDACLQEWRRTEPTAPAEVMVGFELDVNGLQRSWIERDADVPLGVKSCFANAVYGLDWSHVVEQPAKITKDFQLAAPDAGR